MRRKFDPDSYSRQVVITNQLATKLLTAENKPANFDTGDRAVLMPQLGKRSARPLIPGDAWTTANTVRVVLFRGRKGDEMRYAHASSVGSNIEVPWMRYDIDVSLGRIPLTLE